MLYGSLVVCPLASQQAKDLWEFAIKEEGWCGSLRTSSVFTNNPSDSFGIRFDFETGGLSYLKRDLPYTLEGFQLEYKFLGKTNCVFLTFQELLGE